MDTKQTALELINQLIALEKVKDDDYLRLLAKEKVFRNGESVITHGLKTLKELIEKL